MRRAYEGVGWELDAARETLRGLSLGFDRRAEHAQGVAPLIAKLGLAMPEFPVGVRDRQVRQAPAALRYSVYDYEPRDRRRSSYPAALLSLTGPVDGSPALPGMTEPELVARLDLSFVSENGQRRREDGHDLVTAWGACGFAVHVRGARNIGRLEQLHQALLAGDVMVLAPLLAGAPPGPVRLMLASQMSEADKEALTTVDLAHRALMRAARATGIHALLELAGRGYHTLLPDWFDQVRDEVVFCLQPAEPQLYLSGWFSLEELQDWAAGRGPVVRDNWLDALAARPQNRHWESRLGQGLARIGAVARYAPRLVWLDAHKGAPAVRWRATRATEHILPSGNYAFGPLMERYAAPLGQDLRQA